MTEIALVTHTDVPAAFDERMQLAELLSDAGILPDHLRGKTGNIVAMMMIAATLDIPFMTAAQELYPERGRIGMSAMLMRALVLRAGHSFEILEESTKACTVQFTRRGEAPKRPVTYTMEDAQIAGLTNKETYKKNPRAMMLARATSRCLRAHASDVLMGFGYTPDELRDRVDEAPDDDVEIVDEQPVEQPAASANSEQPAEAEIVELPATFGELLAEIKKVVPGPNSKTRKAAEQRLTDLWRHAGGQKWINTPASDADPRPIGNVILARQQWLKNAPFGATGPDDEQHPGQQTLDETPPAPAARGRRGATVNGAAR